MSDRRAYLLMLVSVAVIWLLAVRWSGLPPLTLPSPAKVGEVLWDERSAMLEGTLSTLFTALLGYALANVIALSLAIGSVYIRWLEAFSTPWVVVLKNIPFVALASLLIITMGSSLLPRLIIVVLVCFHPLLANLNQGLKAADRVLIDRMRTLDGSRWEIFRYVLWPSALPYYLAAHEIAFTTSIVGAIVAEWFLSRQGLGHILVQGMTEYRGDRIYAATLISSVLSFGAYWICRAAGRHLTRWQRA